MQKFFFLLIVLMAIVCQVSANEVYIETEGSDRYITLKADSPIAISGYFLQLNFSSKTDIALIEPISPFEGLANIKKAEGYAKVVAYNSEMNSDKQEQIRFASIDYTGSDDIEIIVIEMYDGDNRPVTVTNKEFAVVTPTPTPTAPEYTSQPGYVSPGSSGASTQPTQSAPVIAGTTQMPTASSTAPAQQPQDQTPSETQITGTATIPVSPGESTGNDVPQATPKQNLPVSMYLPLIGLVMVLLMCRARRKHF